MFDENMRCLNGVIHWSPTCLMLKGDEKQAYPYILFAYSNDQMDRGSTDTLIYHTSTCTHNWGSIIRKLINTY